nr:MAG TPA: hypothetical protein [Caudoviricetes sp.]
MGIVENYLHDYNIVIDKMVNFRYTKNILAKPSSQAKFFNT